MIAAKHSNRDGFKGIRQIGIPDRDPAGTVRQQSFNADDPNCGRWHAHMACCKRHRTLPDMPDMRRIDLVPKDKSRTTRTDAIAVLSHRMAGDRGASGKSGKAPGGPA